MLPTFPRVPSKQGCLLLECLCAWHASCWESPFFQDEKLVSLLSNPPGIGQRLDKLQLEHLVRQDWSMFLDNITEMDPTLRQASQSLCETLAPLRLQNVQERVQEQNCTCVHGDYHIANCLFPSNDDDDKRKFVLVDWATCGYGNPMVDVAFVVSSHDEVVSNVHPWLLRYYENLLKWNPQIQVTYETCCEWFQWALLNQWMVLVAYDYMCRGIAQTEPDASKCQHILNHFQRVNRRALLCMTSSFGWTELVASLPVATEEEQHQAKAYSDQTPLAI
jgi:thiamine kinase-like enzyme